MKKFIQCVILAVFLFFLVYLAGAFSFNSLNISDWPDEKRESFGVTGMFAAMGISWLILYIFPWVDAQEPTKEQNP